MAELRSVDPKSLIPNPNNPRRTPTPKAMNDQLAASILAVGLIQPPRVVETEVGLMIVAGNRRRSAAIAAGLPTVEVMVCDADEAADAMRAVSENLIRASMTGVDIWRAIQALEAQAWNEQAIADALALPLRTVRKLKLLAHLHPPMLDVMATGNMPSEDHLRTIAAATREEQAQVWKKHKPKKGQDFYWHEIARALGKRRIPFSAAKFDDDLARAYGVTWHDDLFAPAGEDSRYTMDVEGFFGAQNEWLTNNLPERGTLLPCNEYGQPTLPKKAEHVYGKPGKDDLTGHYLDHYSGEVKIVTYRMPELKKPTKAGKAGEAVVNHMTVDDDASTKPSRPEVTQKGQAMIGDLRTDALHEALMQSEVDDRTLLGLLVLALAGNNVSVQSGAAAEHQGRGRIACTITEGGVLSSDDGTIRRAAREMLVATLSCRDNMSNSGAVARVAGDAIGASLRLTNMATDEFLSCLSKAGVEKVAVAEGLQVHLRGKDTRAAVLDRFKTGHYVHPAALFRLTEEEVEQGIVRVTSYWVPGTSTDAGQADRGEKDDGANMDMPSAEDVDTPEFAHAAE